MGELIVVSWIRAAWRWWRGLGRQLHDLVFRLCLFVVVASVLVVPDRWAGLLGWVWSGLGSSKEQLLTILTGTLAIATYGLFRRTSDLAKETHGLTQRTADAGLLADMHHQQGLSGLVVLSRARVVFQVLHTPAPSTPYPILILTGTLENVGFGPALGIVMTMEHRATGAKTIKHIGSLYPGRPLDVFKDSGRSSVHLATLPAETPELEVGPFLLVTLSWSNIFGGVQDAVYSVTRKMMHLQSRSPLEIIRRRLPTTAEATSAARPSEERESEEERDAGG